MMLLLSEVAVVQAQLSPGELHKSHAFLDGVENCTKCHGTDQKLVADNCLKCHATIGEELVSQTGLHGKQQYKDCQLCHVEHHGRDFALIHWKEGELNFDHSLTGYRLEGKHASIDCRSCHQKKLLVAASKLLEQKITLAKTFLGLSNECKNCHFDEHRGQLNETCGNCHSSDDWKPTKGFDHAKTVFPLVGKHADVFCAKCHLTQSDGSTSDDGQFAKFTKIAHDQCTDCHTDVHNGKLGANCMNCHSVDGWHVANRAEFDHSKTRYPLNGKHAAVACDKCHIPGKERGKLKFEKCQDCHADFHKGEFASRNSKGACEECHTVGGFSPSLFTIALHEESKYPLRGAHQAVPCIACHVEPTKGTQKKNLHFEFASTQCFACHKDPHRGEVTKYVDESGCEFCHSVDSWQLINFAHGITKFGLEGKHADVSCRKCHTSDMNGLSQLTFVSALEDCQSCHTDTHAGQFASNDVGGADCQRCHSPRSWKQLTFEHNRDSKFKLEGAHQKVPCTKCHTQRTEQEPRTIVYKPLAITCASCHGTNNLMDKEKES